MADASSFYSSHGLGTRGAWTVGRAPWYDNQECRPKSPLLIGVTGGTASGKTTVCAKTLSRLDTPWVASISMDSFYRPLDPQEREEVYAGNYNFDHPNAFDWELFESTIREIKQGKSVLIPVYCFKTHARLPSTQRVYGADVVMVEGILTLHSPKIRELLDIKIFVTCSPDLALIRRIRRDIVERGRNVESVLTQYELFVKPSFDSFIGPSKQYADIIIPHTNPNPVAIEMLVMHVQHRLIQRSAEFKQEYKLLPHVASVRKIDKIESVPLPHNVKVMKLTNALRAIHTLIRSGATPPTNFVYEVNRLSRLVIEYGLSYLPFQIETVNTPTSMSFHGAKFSTRICGVSVLRGGVAMEQALRQVCQDVRIGKIAIQQTAEKKLGPRLYYTNLPADISSRKVLLLDPVLGTSHTVKMAIRVLLDHGVPEENIIYVALIVTDRGARALSLAFPRITIVTSAVDGTDATAESEFASPGLGCFGERYYSMDSGLEKISDNKLVVNLANQDDF